MKKEKRIISAVTASAIAVSAVAPVNINFEKASAEEVGEVQVTAAENFVYSVDKVGGKDMVYIKGLAEGVELKEIVVPKEIDGKDVYRVDLNNLGIEKLDVSRANGLKRIYANQNKFSTIDLRGLMDLEVISMYKGQVEEIHMDTMHKLWHYGVYGNKITGFDQTKMPNLRELKIYSNNLTSLEVNNLTVLEELYAQDNKINEIDLRGLSKLREINLNSDAGIESMKLSA